MAVASCGDIRTHEPFGTYHLAEPSPFPQLDQELEQVQAENKAIGRPLHRISPTPNAGNCRRQVLKSELLRGRQAFRCGAVTVGVGRSAVLRRGRLWTTCCSARQGVIRGSRGSCGSAR